MELQVAVLSNHELNLTFQQLTVAFDHQLLLRLRSFCLRTLAQVLSLILYYLPNLARQ